METEYTQVFNDSFQRCTGDSDFLGRFYQIFLSSSEEVRAKFLHTDMQRQKKIMLKSLAYMVHASSNPASIHKTAINHDKHHLNIDPHFYELWLESMIKAVEQTDQRFNEKVEQAWRETLQPGINHMIKQYHAS